MSEPPAKKGLNNCRAKIRYSDELSARANVSVLCERHKTERRFIYACPHCSGWHATKQFHPTAIPVTAENTFDITH
tara:strand:- start:5727 stop:5954 length:228 start_codon:yes stop_codon:yes gene_type:complete